MGERGRLASQGGHEERLPRRIGEAIFAADHVGDSHVRIVYGGGEKIRKGSVRAGHDEVPQVLEVEAHFAANQIAEYVLAPGDGETPSVGLAQGHAPFALGALQSPTSALVAGRL